MKGNARGSTTREREKIAAGENRGEGAERPAFPPPFTELARLPWRPPLHNGPLSRERGLSVISGASSPSREGARLVSYTLMKRDSYSRPTRACVVRLAPESEVGVKRARGMLDVVGRVPRAVPLSLSGVLIT